MSKNAYLFPRGILGIGVILTFVSPPGLLLSGVVSDTDTRYSRVVIKDAVLGGRPVRVLQVDREYWQSGVYADGDNRLVFPYARTFDDVARLNPEAKDYLVIGGGAFTFPAHLAVSRPDASVEVVEIDEGLVALSERYFNFTNPDNLKIVIADGRQFLNNNTKKYDAIYLDAFSSVEPPFQLFTVEAVKRTERSLSDGGMAIANVISAASGPQAALIEITTATYRQVFRYVEVFRVADYYGDQRQNLILVASQAPIIPLLEKTGVGTDLAQRRLISVAVSGRTLSDNFAPVERLAASGL